MSVRGFVTCPHNVTSPIADEVGMTPNLPCGEQVEITNLAPVMQLRCPRGHDFTARDTDVRMETFNG